jgi:hypothetical protein
LSTSSKNRTLRYKSLVGSRSGHVLVYQASLIHVPTTPTFRSECIAFIHSLPEMYEICLPIRMFHFQTAEQILPLGVQYHVHYFNMKKLCILATQYICLIWFSDWTVSMSLNSINWFVLIVEALRFLWGGNCILKYCLDESWEWHKSKLHSWNVKSKLNLGNACLYSLQNLLSSHLLSKNLKIQTYKTIILPYSIWDFYSFGYEEYHLLGYDTM